MFKNKISQIINLFEDILNENTDIGRQIVNHFISKLKEVGIVFVQDNLELYEFSNSKLQPDVQSQIYLKIVDILNSLKITVGTIQNYYLIDEACVFHKNNSGEITPVLFMTMINDRKPKSLDEKIILYNQLQKDIEDFKPSFDDMYDGQVYVNLDGESKIYDIFVRRGDIYFGFNNYSFSIKQLGENFNISTNNIVKNIISAKL